ncbi:cupredoxin domain-containing protein [Catellatospora vulcania]|uniref:cupredoxin domain-containing protein n=1 Tax=Catellatospora vulcania TaxID=1460450 RepID=UPI0012D3AC8A|nr:cupredoxin domain-containing protein [Catellatospora vulcania]
MTSTPRETSPRLTASSRLRAIPRLLTASGALAVTFALSGCALWGLEGGPDAQGAATPPAAVTAPPAVAAVLGADGVQRIEITVDDELRLTPQVVTARPGRIELTFRNVGLTPHDIALRIPAGAGTGNINGSASDTVTVEISEPGAYPMPCLYHGTSGMRGTLQIR